MHAGASRPCGGVGERQREKWRVPALAHLAGVNLASRVAGQRGGGGAQREFDQGAHVACTGRAPQGLALSVRRRHLARARPYRLEMCLPAAGGARGSQVLTGPLSRVGHSLSDAGAGMALSASLTGKERLAHSGPVGLVKGPSAAAPDRPAGVRDWGSGPTLVKMQRRRRVSDPGPLLVPQRRCPTARRDRRQQMRFTDLDCAAAAAGGGGS